MKWSHVFLDHPVGSGHFKSSQSLSLCMPSSTPLPHLITLPPSSHLLLPHPLFPILLHTPSSPTTPTPPPHPTPSLLHIPTSYMTPPSSMASLLPSPVVADLATLFECPVCFDYILPPITQCESGHLICTSCRLKLQCCPGCQGKLGAVRNLAMEKVAETVFFPCKHAGSGCSKRFLYTEKRQHEEVCEFRPYACPCPGTSCKWLGHLHAVLDHLLTAHKTITTLHGEDIVFLATDIHLPGAVDWVMMQCCYDHHFILVLEKQERHEGHQQFFVVVQIIGTEKDAEQFKYKLELMGHGRKLTWEAKPRSIHESIGTVIANTDCLVFETAMAQHFGENGNLAINVTIFKKYLC